MITIYDYEDLEKYYSEHYNQYTIDDEITIYSCFCAELSDEDIHVNGDIYVDCSLFGREIRAKSIYGKHVNGDNIIADKINLNSIKGFNIYANYIDCEDIKYHYTCIATQELHYGKIQNTNGYPCHLCLKDLYHENK